MRFSLRALSKRAAKVAGLVSGTDGELRVAAGGVRLMALPISGLGAKAEIGDGGTEGRVGGNGETAVAAEGGDTTRILGAKASD